MELLQWESRTWLENIQIEKYQRINEQSENALGSKYLEKLKDNHLQQISKEINIE